MLNETMNKKNIFNFIQYSFKILISFMYQFAFIFSLLWCFSSGCFCQQLPPIQLDRPDQTECPFIVPKKYFQTEIGFAYEKINTDASGFVLPTALIKYGINDKLELRLITEIEQQKFVNKKSTGLNPITIGFKTKLVEEKNILPMISFIGHLSLPFAATKEYKADHFAPAFRFTFQHTLSTKFSLAYNLGAEWDGFTAAPTFLYTLTTGFSASGKIGTFLELYGFAAQHYRADHRLDAGITYLINNDIMLDVSTGTGISPNAPEYFVSAGFSFRFK